MQVNIIVIKKKIAPENNGKDKLAHIQREMVMCVLLRDLSFED